MVNTAPALADGGGVGTKITSLPYAINNPGFCYLAGNRTYALSAGHGITVNSDDVTIDLMGFCLSSGGAGVGIYMYGNNNVEILNGTVKSWHYGIYEKSGYGLKYRIINIRATNNTHYGIYL
jgi:hypothetical protein